MNKIIQDFPKDLITVFKVNHEKFQADSQKLNLLQAKIFSFPKNKHTKPIIDDLIEFFR